MRRLSVICLALLAAVVGELGAARAAVVVDAKAALGASMARAYQLKIAAARHGDARSFRVVAALRARLAQLDRRKRGRFLSVARPLVAMGHAARWALADELFFSGATRGGLSASAWRGWRISLLEALGRLRRAEMAPLLRAAVRANDADRWVARAALEALARLADSADVDLLVNAASQRGADAPTLLDALGDCRRSAMVGRLNQLYAAPGWDAPARRAILVALGRAGNAWAWRTSAVRKSGEERAVRSAAAKTLVDAYARASDKLERERAATAVLLVAWPQTPALIAAAKQRYPERTARLDALAKRYARSPVR